MSNRTSRLVPHVSSSAETLRRRRKKNEIQQENMVERVSVPFGTLRNVRWIRSRSRQRHLRRFNIMVVIFFIMIYCSQRGGAAAHIDHSSLLLSMFSRHLTFSRQEAQDELRLSHANSKPLLSPSSSPPSTAEVGRGCGSDKFPHVSSEFQTLI